MSRHRACPALLAATLLLSAAFLAGACAEPPDKEMQQAQGAIDAARAAGADQYAHDEVTAAQDALKRAQDAVNDRDYQLALNHALDSRERAQNAAKAAADHKATARSEAEHALAGVAASLDAMRQKLKVAESARMPPAKLADARAALDRDDAAVQKARAAFGRADYLGAIDAAGAAAKDLQAALDDLDAALPSSARRRR